MPGSRCIRGAALLALLLQVVFSFTGHNTPPVFDFKREWIIQEEEPVGSRVAVARTRDEEGDPIEYGIEPASYVDGSHFFRIGPHTGEVLLARSLKGQGGNDFYLYVTANDGHQTAKIEVYVRILPSNAPLSSPFEIPFSTSRPSLRPFPAFSFPPRPPDSSPSASHAPPVISTTSDPTAAEPFPGAPLHPPGSSEAPPPRSVNGLSSSRMLLPVLAVTGLAPLMMLVLWLVHKRCKRTEKLVAQLKKASSSALGGLTETTAFSYSPAALLKHDRVVGQQQERWEVPRHRLQLVCILGEGCFGQVWKAHLQDGEDSRTVAVKTLKESAAEKEKKDLLSELEVMKSLDSHPNVITLIGCCSEKDPVLLVLEYASGGKLQSYLRAERSGGHVTSRQLTLFSHQIAKGMEYLANKGIIHRDLAARNVLLDDSKVCKVADFGFARDVVTSHVYERKSEGRLPIRWMAPESLIDNIYTTKTDVWSFGVLLWEIVTLGSTPYPGLSANEVIRRIRDGFRLEKPEHCRREMYNIMFYCWDGDPALRPSFAELVALLDRLLEGDHAYIELERFPDHSYYNLTDLSGEKL